MALAVRRSPPAEEQIYRSAAARELSEEAQVGIEPADLVPLAHWVTPEIEIRRFDTRFFLVRVPDGQEARHDEGETTELEWCPAEAMQAAERGKIMLPPPTWTTLKRLAPHASIDEAGLGASTAHSPRAADADQDRRVHHPHAARRSDLSRDRRLGIPEDTRFRLQDGRWRPVPV